MRLPSRASRISLLAGALILLSTVLGRCGGSSSTPLDGGLQDGGPVLGDGGPPDSGTDAGVQDSGTQDAGCPYVYCEDFEGYDAGAITNGALIGPWTAAFSGSRTTMTVDPSGGYLGSKALRVTITYVDPDGGQVRATLHGHAADGGAVVGPDLFGRAEIFYAALPGDAGLPIGVHSWFFNAAGRQPDGGSTSMNLGGGGAKLQLNYQYPPIPKFPDGGPVSRRPDGGLYPTEDSVQGGLVTTGSWHCVQWEYQGPPGNIGNVWIDGSPAITVNNPAPLKNWELSDAYSSFDFGFTHYQQLRSGVDFFLDDFALDGAMIPCP